MRDWWAPEFSDHLKWQPWMMNRLTPSEYRRGVAYVARKQRIEAKGA